MKIARIAIGVLIVLAALYVIVGEQLAGASADAVVNARLTTLRTPIAGQLSMPSREFGALVEAGEDLARIEDPLADDVRLNDLELEYATSKSDIARMAREISAIEEALAPLRDRARKYGAQRVEQLQARLEARHAQARAIEARLEEARSALTRSSELQNRGYESAASLDRAKAQSRVAARELEAANAEIQIMEIELEAARDGVFLGEGYNDAPYSEQRISELEEDRRGLLARRLAEQRRVVALRERLDAERRRVNRLLVSQIQANARGRVWEVLAADGERVQRGQDILRLVDCTSIIVTVSVSENVFNDLRTGDAASFRLIGESRTYDGTVLRLAGAGAATVYRNLAVAPSKRHLERYDVAIKAPGLIEDGDAACAVGRTGRAFFEDRPLDFLRRFWD